MKVSGFSIIRDGVRLGYPFLESIRSVLPLVDEFVVAVGDCSDDTRQQILGLDIPNLRIIDTTWAPTVCSGGQLMAQQTNIALDACRGDWCFYIQGDEVLHEGDQDAILNSMRRWHSNQAVEGLTFRYLHFMGDYTIRNPLSYRKQVRIVRNGKGIRSVGDACGFGVADRKLRTRSSGGRVFHYGYVRPPEEMARKSKQFSYFYRGESLSELPPPDLDAVDPWSWDLRSCRPYHDSHPAVMSEIIANKDWRIDFQYTPWYRNKAWWHGFLRKNFSSMFRKLENRKKAKAELVLKKKSSPPFVLKSTSDGIMNNIHIIARKNGVGLDRDVDLMRSVLCEIGQVDWRSQKKPEPVLSQLRTLLVGDLRRSRSRLFLLTERVPRLLGRLPGIVALVPNQERFPRRHLNRLRHVDHVLCKTRHAASVFSAYTDNVRYIGFTSNDRNLPAITPDYSRFFHLAGKSTLKGTNVLVEVWAKHPEWPELTIIESEVNANRTIPKNVTLITDFVEEEALRKMQNEHGVHLCTSLSEGWGHYIVEAMSCGALVVTTDGPPMNELVTPERGVLVPWHKSEPRHLGTDWHIDPEAFEIAIQKVLDMPKSQKSLLGNAARTWFEENDRAFRRRFSEFIGQLLAPNEVVGPATRAA